MIKNFTLKLKNRFTDLKYSVWLLRKILELKSSSVASFFFFWILYSIPRLFFGEKRSIDISENIIKRFFGGNLIIPMPTKHSGFYYIGIKDETGLDAFREVCLNDLYNYSQLKSGAICVDAGAHIGTFSLLASLMVGKEGRVIAVEPETENFTQLVKNLELNKAVNVVPVNVALSDSEGKEKFFIDQGSGCHSFIAQKSSIKEIEVKTKPLDALLKEMKITKIDLLKIDTEGAELKILKGARETLLNNPQMKMEIASYHYPEEVSEVVEYLKELNFSPKIIISRSTLVVVS